SERARSGVSSVLYRSGPSHHCRSSLLFLCSPRPRRGYFARALSGRPRLGIAPRAAAALQADAALPNENMTSPPFPRDELAAQARAGVKAGGAGIRPFMPDQHRTFFAMQPILYVSSLDAEGWPLASVLTGAPGFVHSPEPTLLRIDTRH